MAELEAEGEEADQPKGQLSVGGFVRHRSGLWVERLKELPLAQARSSLDANLRYKRPLSVAGLALDYRLVVDIHFEYDLAYQVDRSAYDQATLDAYESQVIGGETYLALAYDALELTIGRQIVAWGQGDMFSPLDIVNPRDLREPGLAELDDIRLAVLATRVGLFFGLHRFELMAIHEANWGLRPAPLSPYSPLRKLLSENPAVAALLGDRSLRYADEPEGIGLDERTQWLVRWQYKGPGLDLAVYGARTLDQRGIIQPPALAPGNRPLPPVVALELDHKPYWMVGHAGATPMGDFIFKWELGFDLDRPLNAQGESQLDLAAIRRHQLNWLAGITYAGIEDGSLALEYAQSFLFDHPKRDPNAGQSVLFPVEQPSFGALFRQTYLRERLSLNVSIAAFGFTKFLGVLGRAELNYELEDALEVGVGFVTYHPDDNNFGPLYGLERNDRVYATVRYDFLLD